MMPRAFLVFRGHCAKLRQLALTALRVFVDVSGVVASFLRVFEFVCVFFVILLVVVMLFEAGGIIFELSSIFLVFFKFSSSFLGVYLCFRYFQCFLSLSVFLKSLVFFVLFEAGGIIFEFSSVFPVFFWFSSSFLGVYWCFRDCHCFSRFSRPVESSSSFR